MKVKHLSLLAEASSEKKCSKGEMLTFQISITTDAASIFMFSRN